MLERTGNALGGGVGANWEYIGRRGWSELE